MRAGILVLTFFMTAPVGAVGWLPDAASFGALTVDRDFTLLLVFSAVGVFALFFVVDLLIVMNLRQEPGQLGTTPRDGRLYRVLAVLVPLLLVIALLTFGVRG